MKNGFQSGLFISLVFTVLILLNTPACEAYISQSEMVIGNISFGTSLNKVKQLYGEPDKIEITHRTSGQGDVARVTYENMLNLVAINNKVVACTIYSPQITTSYGVKVGDSINRLRPVYGKEDGYFGVVIRYEAIEDKDKNLSFGYKNGTITNIGLNSKENGYIRPEGFMPSSQLALGGIHLTNTMADVVKSYGFPKRYRDGSAIYGNGLEITYWENSNSSQIRDIRVTDNNGFATPSGITVGMNENIIKKLHGTPDNLLLTRNEHKYTYYGSGYDCLKYMQFTTQNGIITEIFLHWAD